jgi:hypothetical protein
VKRCLCAFIPKVAVRALGVELTGLRCPACVDAIVEKCNETTRDNYDLRRMVEGMAARIVGQSELLSRRAERPDA